MTTTINASATNGLVSTADGSGILDVGADNTVTFSTASTERMRIDSSGTAMWNTTSDYAAAQLSSNVNGILHKSNGVIYTSQNNAGSIFSRSTTGTLIGCYYQNTSVGAIVVSTTNTSYNTTSDYRLKENIQPMQGALAVVQQLNPVTYTWKADGSDGQGFIAHELQAVVPDCVTGDKDAVDADGNPVYQSIDTSFLVATLTAAIQEQQAIIEQLKADVATLKGQA